MKRRWAPLDALKSVTTQLLLYDAHNKPYKNPSKTHFDFLRKKGTQTFFNRTLQLLKSLN